MNRFLFSLPHSLAIVAFVLCLLAVGLEAPAAWAQPAQDVPPSFSKFIVFGDSLSDVGDLAKRTNDKFGIRYPGPHFNYADGRFTNGAETSPASRKYVGVWHEQLARDLQLSPATASLDGGLDYAFGGATTQDGTHDVQVGDGNLTLTINDLGKQVDDYLKGRAAEPGALYILWGGANDLLSDHSASSISGSAARIGNLVSKLARAGGRSFLVANVPPLGDVPSESGKPQEAAALNAASAQYRSQLNAALNAAEAGFSSTGLSVKIYRLDIFDLFTRVRQNAEAFGFSNTSDSAQGQAVDADKYLFWDSLHPTIAGHHQIALAALNLLLGSAPAPATLSLSIAPSVLRANAGARAATGTLSRSGPTSAPLAVALSSSDTRKVRVPSSVTLPAGAKSVTFEVAVVDDGLAEGTRSITISARAASFKEAQAVVSVLDATAPALSLSLSSTRIREGGASAAILTIKRNTKITSQSRALIVSLSATPAGQLSIPSSVIISAQSASVKVRLSALNNKLAGRPHVVTITARAPGFRPARLALTVEDGAPSSRFSITGRVLLASAHAGGATVGVPQVLVTLSVGTVVYDQVLSDAERDAPIEEVRPVVEQDAKDSQQGKSKLFWLHDTAVMGWAQHDEPVLVSY